MVLFTKFIKVYEGPYVVYAGMETEVKTELMSAARLARLNGLTCCRLVADAEPEWLVGFVVVAPDHVAHREEFNLALQKDPKIERPQVSTAVSNREGQTKQCC